MHHWEFTYLGVDEDAMVMMSRKNADYRRLRMEGTDAEVASAMTRLFDDDRDLLAR